MFEALENVVDQYERGAITRRQLITALLALGVPSVASAQQAKPIVPGLSVNHVHFDVVDLDKSIAFYRDLLGATVRDTSPGNATLSLPGKPAWISLTKTTEEKGRYNHIGFGVPFSWVRNDAARVAQEINARFPDAKAAPTGDTAGGKNTRSVYLYDPSGIRFQLNPNDDDGWLPTGVVGSKIMKGEKG